MWGRGNDGGEEQLGECGSKMGGKILSAGGGTTFVSRKPDPPGEKPTNQLCHTEKVMGGANTTPVGSSEHYRGGGLSLNIKQNITLSKPSSTR